MRRPSAHAEGRPVRGDRSDPQDRVALSALGRTDASEVGWAQAPDSIGARRRESRVRPAARSVRGELQGRGDPEGMRPRQQERVVVPWRRRGMRVAVPHNAEGRLVVVAVVAMVGRVTSGQVNANDQTKSAGRKESRQREQGGCLAPLPHGDHCGRADNIGQSRLPDPDARGNAGVPERERSLPPRRLPAPGQRADEGRDPAEVGRAIVSRAVRT